MSMKPTRHLNNTKPRGDRLDLGHNIGNIWPLGSYRIFLRRRTQLVHVTGPSHSELPKHLAERMWLLSLDVVTLDCCARGPKICK